MTARRLQRRRTKGARLPAGTVNCCRPGILGNLFVHDTDPAQAVAAFERLVEGGTQSFTCGPSTGLRIAPNAHRSAGHWAYADWFRSQLPALRGRDLACYCALCPEHAEGRAAGVVCEACAPCHVDVILRRANPECYG